MKRIVYTIRDQSYQFIMERHNQRTISKMYESNQRQTNHYRRRNIWFNEDENVWSDDEDEDSKRTFTMSYIVGDCMKRMYLYLDKR